MKFDRMSTFSTSARGTFVFGEALNYWRQSDSCRQHLYVAPIHDSIKEEVMSQENDYQLDENTWHKLLAKVKQLRSGMYNDADAGRMDPIYAKTRPYYNTLFGIKPG